MLQLRHLKLSIAQSIRTMKLHVAPWQAHLGHAGFANPGPARRIKLFDHGLTVLEGADNTASTMPVVAPAVTVTSVAE